MHKWQWVSVTVTTVLAAKYTQILRFSIERVFDGNLFKNTNTESVASKCNPSWDTSGKLTGRKAIVVLDSVLAKNCPVLPKYKRWKLCVQTILFLCKTGFNRWRIQINAWRSQIIVTWTKYLILIYKMVSNWTTGCK